MQDNRLSPVELLVREKVTAAKVAVDTPLIRGKEVCSLLTFSERKVESLHYVSFG